MSRLWLHGTFLVIAGLTVGQQNATADKESAAELLAEGNTLLESNNARLALEKFQAAYAAFPSSSLFLNLGTALRALGRNAEAANKYADWVADNKDSSRLAEVEAVLRELDTQVARLTIDTSETGAKVTIDGRNRSDMATTRTVRLAEGSYRVAATKAGFQAKAVLVSLSPGDDRRISIEMTKQSIEEGASVPAQIEGDTPGWHRDPVGWALVGGGLAAGGLGVGLLVSASTKQRDANSEVDQSKARELESSARNRRIGGAIVTGVGGMLVLGGVIKLILHPTSPESAGIALVPSPDGAMVGFWSRF